MFKALSLNLPIFTTHYSQKLTISSLKTVDGILHKCPKKQISGNGRSYSLWVAKTKTETLLEFSKK